MDYFQVSFQEYDQNQYVIDYLLVPYDVFLKIIVSFINKNKLVY